MTTGDETFEDFLTRREAVSTDYINGRSASLIAISAAVDPATFFPPSGARVRGAAAVNAANEQGAAIFGEGSKGHFEIWQSGSDGDLGFWTGIQHAEVMMKGKDASVSMQLRVTKVFRRKGDEWTLVHRHADAAAEKP
jgi:ketosteroid isomerase-like protein